MFSERSEAAQVLLELGAEAGMKDSDGQLCITALIGQMSPVVKMSLLLTEDRAVIGPKTFNVFVYVCVRLFMCSLVLLCSGPAGALSVPHH